MRSLKPALIITAATIGSGAFALPYVVAQAGWALALFYYGILGAMVVIAHAAYLATLSAENEKWRLLGLARKHFGALGFWFGFVTIVVGLLLSFVIFHILGTQFIRLLIPASSYPAALFAIWLLLAVPTFLGSRRVTMLEMVSVLCVAAIVVFVFASSNPAGAFTAVPAVNWQNFFLPFGVILFTLAGWTGVEPFYEESQGRALAKARPWRGLVLGTGFAVIIYLLFIAGILSSATTVTTDTVSGLIGWPVWKRDVIALVGILVVATVAMPISHELRNAFEKDLRWPRALSRGIIVGLPLAVVLLGFNNFLAVVGLAGGVFLSLQYLLIVVVARRALKISAPKKFLLGLIAFIFLAAAVYETVQFVIH